MIATAWLWLLGNAGAVDVHIAPDQGPFRQIGLSIGGYVQPRLRHTPRDKDAGTPGEVGFSLKQARFETSAAFLPSTRHGLAVTGKLSVELMPEARLQDAFMNLGVGFPVEVRFGQFKVPYGRSTLTSDDKALLPDNPLIAEWVVKRDMGFMVHGRLARNLVEYQAGIWNGEGTNRLSNVNRKFLYAVRAVVSPLGGPGTGSDVHLNWGADEAHPTGRFTFSVGASGHLNIEGPPGQETGTRAVGGEVFAHWRWVTAQGEVFFRHVDYQDTAISDYHQVGGYGQVSSFLPKVPWADEHVSVLFRFEQGDSLVAPDVRPAGPSDSTQGTRRFHVGAALHAGQPWFRDPTTLRLVVVYTVRTELEDFPFSDDTFTAQANLTF